MDITPEHLLFSGALDVRRRYVRLISILRQAASSAGPAERKLIEALSESIRTDLAGYANKMAITVQAGRATSATDVLSSWNARSRKELAFQASNGYTDFRIRHDEAYTYISRHVSVPNDLLHFLFRSLGLSLVSDTHRQAVALYPSRHLMWESSSSLDEKSRVVAAILVPYSEIASPTRWPLLVHELAHHIAPGGANSDALREEVLRDNPQVVLDATSDESGSTDADSRDDGLGELQADATAELATGLTYAIAMAREGFLIADSAHFAPGGPTVKQRLESLRFGTTVAAALPPEWRLDGTRHDREKGTVQETPNEEEMAELRRLADLLRVGREPSPSSPRVERARALMRVDEPTPAVPRIGVPGQEHFVEVAAGGADPAKVKLVFDSLADVALTDTEILEATWAEELDLTNVLDALTADPTPETLEVELEKLEADDVRLSRSLQAAAVHRWLLDNDNEIRRSVAEDEPPIVEGWETDTSALPESSPLSDVQLARRLTLPVGHLQRLVVRPIVDPSQVGGTTIDLRLGTEWEVLRTSRFRSLDPSDDHLEVTDRLNESVEEFRLTSGEKHGLVLHPGELLLALTLEYLSLPDDLWGQLEGRSTWARVGLQVHATAGMVDAGFKGFLTLELQNTGPLPMVLYPGLRVGQMAFFPVKNIARPYGKKPGAAYAKQSKVRTAFTRQHEHIARHEYLERERQQESQRQAEATAPAPVDADD